MLVTSGLRADELLQPVFNRALGPDDHLFWNVSRFQGDTRRLFIKHQTLWVRIKNIGEAAREKGVIKRDVIFSPHLFRRSYATTLYRAGKKIKVIQEKTRHASIETLAKHYVYDDEPAQPYLERMLI
jgi:integrase